MLSNQNPSLIYRLIDAWGNNCLFGFVYGGYIRRLGLSGNENVLDFGSGSGAGARRLAKVLRQGGGRLTCCDISAYWMEVAKKRLHRFSCVDFALGDLTERKLREGSFDVVTVHYALHEVTSSLRAETVLEFHRLLKPGGKVCIAEPNRKNDGMARAEIRSLMAAAGLCEQSSRDGKNVFEAVFGKPPV